MFTGLISRVGRLVSLSETEQGARMTVAHEPWDTPLELGESVAVQGACFTVSSLQEGSFACDILAETLSRTCLGRKRPGDRLNLERALRPADRMGGHMVSGHVDGTGTLVSKSRAGRDRVLQVGCARELLEGMVPKGSIACDGVSLTIAVLRSDSFDTHIIPHTLEHTSLQYLQPGQTINLETDLIGKYVRRFSESARSGSGVSWDDLRRSGFLS